MRALFLFFAKLTINIAFQLHYTSPVKLTVLNAGRTLNEIKDEGYLRTSKAFGN